MSLLVCFGLHDFFHQVLLQFLLLYLSLLETYYIRQHKMFRKVSYIQRLKEMEVATYDPHFRQLTLA